MASTFTHYTETKREIDGVHLAYLLGKVVHVVEAVVIGGTLSIPLHRGKTCLSELSSSP